MSDTQSVEEISLSEARAENIGLQDEGNREATSDIQSRATATDAVSSSTPVNEGSGSAVVSLSRVNPSVARTAVSSGSSITRPNFMTLNSFPNEPPPPYPHSDRRLLNFSSPHVPLAENNSTEQRRMTHNITRIRNIDETENVQVAIYNNCMKFIIMMFINIAASWWSKQLWFIHVCLPVLDGFLCAQLPIIDLYHTSSDLFMEGLLLFIKDPL